MKRLSNTTLLTSAVLSECRPPKTSCQHRFPRASFDFDFKHDSLLTKRSQRLFIRLASRALLAPIGGSFASVRPLYLTGFSPKTTDGLLSSSPNLVAFKPFSSRFRFFILGGGPRGHEPLPSSTSAS